MTYKKPAISLAIDATTAVQSGAAKPDMTQVDGGLMSRQTPNAYEADE
jgi:hypothetical protein